MPKFYVESGAVRLVFGAKDALEAAVKAFQWTCDRQATLEADTPMEHVLEAERRGWQLADVVHVNERGFGRRDGVTFETRDVLEVWQELPDMTCSTWRADPCQDE